MSDFEKVLDKSASKVEEQLKRMLPRVEGPEGRLNEAMRYAALAGGKRFRPFLALETASMFGVSEDRALRVAVAIECIHTYSLIHDDLPCMDDDDLRRGQPSTHIAFDEATAVLAGDGLQAFAFEVLAKDDTHEDPNIRVELVRQLARASGPRGMVGGQMIDLDSEGKTLDVGSLTRLHQLKTGALIAFACDAGAILGRASPALSHALHAYAHDLGLAYQVADDVLDVEGDRETLGKTAGKDAQAGKATFVSVLGLERAQAQAQLLANQAVQHLDIFDERADRLRQAAQFVVSRRA